MQGIVERWVIQDEDKSGPGPGSQMTGFEIDYELFEGIMEIKGQMHEDAFHYQKL